MNEITINKEKVTEVYQNASDETKEALKTLFGNEINFKRNPTLNDHTTIRSYKDACKALGEPVFKEPGDMPKHIVALMKLETISRALWGKDWKPKPDVKGSKWFYYPVFALYPKHGIKNMYEDERKSVLSASTHTDAAAGFGFLDAYNRSSDAFAYFSFRLCQETEEKAEYFGEQFIELWAEYLKFGFEVGGRLK